eukprot:127003-Ditylum_brightwellii.AAC.1
MSVEHALSCAQGGLVLIRHNNARDEWGALGRTALIPSAVAYEPLIHSGRTALETRPDRSSRESETTGATAEPERPPGAGETEARAPADEDVALEDKEVREQVPGMERGDVLIHGFWKRGTTSIFNVRITNLDAKTHRVQEPAK